MYCFRVPLVWLPNLLWLLKKVNSNQRGKLSIISFHGSSFYLVHLPQQPMRCFFGLWGRVFAQNYPPMPLWSVPFRSPILLGASESQQTQTAMTTENHLLAGDAHLVSSIGSRTPRSSSSCSLHICGECACSIHPPAGVSSLSLSCVEQIASVPCCCRSLGRRSQTLAPVSWLLHLGVRFVYCSSIFWGSLSCIPFLVFNSAALLRVNVRDKWLWATTEFKPSDCCNL